MWSLPVTLLGLIYACVFWALRWYQWQGIHGGVFVWSLNEKKAPQWLLNAWSGWGGHTIGVVVVLDEPPAQSPVVLRHEQEHARQCMVLGVFQPVVYLMMLLAAKTLRNVDAYRANTFEIDARVAAKQHVEPVTKN